MPSPAILACAKRRRRVAHKLVQVQAWTFSLGGASLATLATAAFDVDNLDGARDVWVDLLPGEMGRRKEDGATVQLLTVERGEKRRKGWVQRAGLTWSGAALASAASTSFFLGASDAGSASPPPVTAPEPFFRFRRRPLLAPPFWPSSFSPACSAGACASAADVAAATAG